MAWRMGRALEVGRGALAERGILRPIDLEKAGTSRGWIRIMEIRDIFERQPPGVLVPRYSNYPLAVRAAVKWPNAVVSGLSALHLHGVCEEPAAVWFAIDGHARLPKATIPMTISRCEHLTEDPDVVLVPNGQVQVRAFTAARALVECLRRLEAVPIEPVRAALSRALREAKTTEAELLDCASRRRSRAIVAAALDVLRG